MRQHTIFGDLRHHASTVYRVRTQGSTYVVGVHEDLGRKHVVVRGEPGSDRENVVLRDTDPRVGEHSLYELPVAEWIGRQLCVATMTSSPIVAAAVDTDPDAAQLVSASASGLPAVRWAPVPAGLPQQPCIVPAQSRGTIPGDVSSASISRDVVVGAGPAREVEPYPDRHVRYAEDAATLLRSISRRDRLFDDVDDDRDLRERLRRALDDCAKLLDTIDRRRGS